MYFLFFKIIEIRAKILISKDISKTLASKKGVIFSKGKNGETACKDAILVVHGSIHYLINSSNIFWESAMSLSLY